MKINFSEINLCDLCGKVFGKWYGKITAENAESAEKIIVKINFPEINPLRPLR